MKKSIRAVALAAAIMLTASSLVGCSAYKNPEKYITIPGKGEVVVKNSDIQKEYDENKKEILEDNRETEYTKLEDENETVKDGDRVNIYYDGKPVDESLKLSAETLKGMKYTKETEDKANEEIEDEDDKAHGYDLVIGSGSFIKEYVDSSDEKNNTDGFEEQLIGAKAGDTVTVKITFPADYQTTELQKVVAEFTVTINSISRAYVNDDTQITVGYEFTNPNATEDKEDDKEDDTQAQADSDNDSDDEAETPTETKKFEDIFKSGTFTYDFADVDSSKGKKLFDFIEIDDYIEKLKNVAINDNYTVKVTVPDDADDAYKDYKGKEIEMKLTVTKIDHQPDWDDKFIKTYTSGQYKTVAEYEEYAKKALSQSKAFEVISEKVVVNEYPKSELESAYKNYVYQLVYSKLGNKDPGDFTQKELSEKISESDYQTIYNSAAVSAKDSVKQRLTIEYLCNYFEITISKKEYTEKLESELSSNFYTYYQYGIYSVNSLESYYGKDYFELQFKTEKMLEKITEYVTFED